MSIKESLITILNLISGFVGVVIGGHILLLLVGANTSAPIVLWVNNASNFLIYPFRGLFQTIILNSRSAIDITAIVALLVYAIIFSLLYRVVHYLTHLSRTSDIQHSHV